MNKYKIILNHLLDLGGLATKNNFYSPEATTLLGALIHTRKVFSELTKNKLIVALPTITRVRNLCQEQFFAITRLGAKFVDREIDYKWRSIPKSPYNIMHESMVRDVGLGFMRNFPEYEFNINCNEKIESIRPDLTIRMKNQNTNKKYIFLIEVERKKSPDRVIREKLNNYEKVLSNLNFRKHRLNAPVKVLFVYASIDYNPFIRPQEYEKHRYIIEKQKKQIQKLARNSRISEHRYAFLPFYQFHRLNEAIWLAPSGNNISVL
jgi:protein involved in plasmid replication-relaxation